MLERLLNELSKIAFGREVLDFRLDVNILHHVEVAHWLALQEDPLYSVDKICRRRSDRNHTLLISAWLYKCIKNRAHAL
jgi:hypothetical protein